MQKHQKKEKSTSKSTLLWVILLLLLIFLLFWILRSHKNGYSEKNDSQISDSTLISDSVHNIDTTESIIATTDTIPSRDSISDTVISVIDSSLISVIDSSKIKKVDKKKAVSKRIDSTLSPPVVQKDSAVADSGETSTDSIIFTTDLCIEDTASLWVYPDPSGGLHRKAIAVALIANKTCTIRYRILGSQSWIEYRGEDIMVDSTLTLQFEAIDSCGKKMEMREEYYEIEILQTNSPCGSEMELVTVGNSSFCIDRYEWPNQKGAIPKAYVSLYQAMDSCYSVGKRLCTSEEWMLACSGPQTWSYPYGQRYERYACVTHGKSVSHSGSKPECRSFFGAYDMSGSLLEWTSTRVTDKRQFYYVMGGFWESGQQSGCSDKRYSYYPENQHNPVGFRCCADIPLNSEVRDEKNRKGSGR